MVNETKCFKTRPASICISTILETLRAPYRGDPLPAANDEAARGLQTQAPDLYQLCTSDCPDHIGVREDRERRVPAGDAAAALGPRLRVAWPAAARRR